jgi:hypothetical protein
MQEHQDETRSIVSSWSDEDGGPKQNLRERSEQSAQQLLLLWKDHVRDCSSGA